LPYVLVDDSTNKGKERKHWLRAGDRFLLNKVDSKSDT